MRHRCCQFEVLANLSAPDFGESVARRSLGVGLGCSDIFVNENKKEGRKLMKLICLRWRRERIFLGRMRSELERKLMCENE